MYKEISSPEIDNQQICFSSQSYCERIGVCSFQELMPVGCTVDLQGCLQRMSRSGGSLNWQSATPQSLPVLHATTSALQANQECIERTEYKSTVGIGGSDSKGR